MYNSVNIIHYAYLCPMNLYILHTTRSATKVDEVDQISHALDEHLFEPYYQATLATNHMNLAEVMSVCKSAGRIHSRLVNIKVSCAVVSVLSLSFSAYNLMAGRIPMAALNLLLSIDCLRVSYNCYLKNYCSIFIRQHFGNATKVKSQNEMMLALYYVF